VRFDGLILSAMIKNQEEKGKMKGEKVGEFYMN